jgi:hypothetical protein
MLLRQQLVAAKAAYLAIKSPAPMPHATAIRSTQRWLEKYAREVGWFDRDNALPNISDITISQISFHRRVISDRDAVLAYRLKRAAASQVVADLQQQLIKHVAHEAEVKQRISTYQTQLKLLDKPAPLTALEHSFEDCAPEYIIQEHDKHTYQTYQKRKAAIDQYNTERRAILTKILELQQSLLPPSDLE